MYRIEDTEAAIQELQRLLSLNQTGVYDRITKERVTEMQQKNSLPITGIADYETFVKITEEYRDNQNKIWISDYLFNPTFPFVEADIGDNVEKINYALNLVLKEYTYEGALPKGKYLGRDTISGARYLRRIFGMNDSDEIDIPFLNRIMLEKRAIESKMKIGI